jgi:hypothetical protein
MKSGKVKGWQGKEGEAGAGTGRHVSQGKARLFTQRQWKAGEGRGKHGRHRKRGEAKDVS